MQKFIKETTRDNLYLDYFTALNGVLKLTGKELVVLASVATIITTNDNKFTKEQREDLCKELDMSTYNFNNFLNKLCKRSLIAKKETRYYLNPSLIVDPSKQKYTLSFTFNIK